MNYYEIENILAEETKLTVKFNFKIKKFGFFVSELDKDINAYTKVNIPIFLSIFFITNNHSEICDELIPEETKNDLLANASIINLKSISEYFYYCSRLFYDHKYIDSIFYTRLGKNFTLIFKEQLSEDDLCILDFKEKKLLTSARKHYLGFRQYFIME